MKKILALLYLSTIISVSYSQTPFIKHDYPVVRTPDMGVRIDFKDMDNDGDEDLINWAGSSSSVPFRVYRSNGTSIDSLDYTNFSVSETSKLADWDLDGLPDLVDVYTWTDQITIIKNLGNMTFAPIETMATSTQNDYDTAQISNDNYIDLVTWTSNSIILYMNNNGANSVTPYTVTSSTNLSSSTSIAFNDIENDGLKEMFVRNVSNKIYIYSHTGSFDYTLTDSIVSTNIGATTSGEMRFSDMNNDGFNELIFRNGWNILVFDHTSGYAYSQVYVGYFSYTVNTGFGFASAVELSDIYDVDGNGYLDFVSGNSVFFNNGSFSFNEVGINAVPRYYEAYLKCTDVDGDGNTDICYVHATSNTHFEMAFYRSENTTGQTIDEKKLIWYNWGYGDDGEATDFDNDGDIDVCVYNIGKAELWENVNDTLYPRYVGQGYDYYTEFIDMVDMNNDGFEDVVTSTAADLTDEHFYRFNLNGEQLSDQTFMLSSDMHLKLVEDIDGDGIQELFYHRLSGSTNNYIYMYRLNTGIPVLAGTVMYWTDYSVGDAVIRLSDYDSDGDKDLIVQHEAAGWHKIRMAANNGDNTFTVGQVISCGCVELLDVFDSNGDNLPDLHWHNGDNRIYRNLNSNGTFIGGAIINTMGSASFSNKKGKAIDLNNDDIMDLVVQSNTSQFLFRNLGNGLVLINNEPATRRLSRIVDLDSDGDMDIVSENIWYENTLVSPFRTVGTVYYDINENGNYEEGTDVMFPLFPIQLSNGSLIEYTNNDGHFDIPLGSNPGSFNISMAPDMLTDFEATTIPYPAVATVDELNPIDSVSIGVKNLNSIVDGTFDITLSGHRCNEPGRIYLNFQNVSPQVVNAEVKVVLAANTQFVSSNMTSTQEADTVTWLINNVNPFENVMFYANLDMPGTSSMGDTMVFTSKATLTGTLGTISLQDTIKQILTCAYDPNDKQISMLDHIYMTDSIFAFDDYIEYTVRFQNTGNDTARNVVIKDNLTNLFDRATLRPISASASYNFTIDSLGIIEVSFENINLPDSSTNFLGSMGYIKFSVEYDDASPRFVPVSNQARIYFDENPPIYTNMHRFFRVDCSDFINIASTSSTQCENDSLFMVNNDFGLPFDYLWTIESYNSNDEGSTYLPLIGSGTVNYSLEIENSHCTADSLLTINVLPSPEITLNMGDSVSCQDYSVYITADQTVTWWDNVSQLTTINDYYYVYMDQPITVMASTTGANGCTDTVTIQLDMIERPFLAHEADTDPSGFSYAMLCGNEEITLNSAYGSADWWVFYFSGEPEIIQNSESITIPYEPFETGIQVDSYLFYENCYFFNTVVFYIDPSADLLIFGDATDGQTTNVCEADTVGVYADHLVDWYLDGTYLQTSYWINANQSGTYTAEDDCQHTVSFQVMNSEITTTNENVSVCYGASYSFPDGTQQNNLTEPLTYTSTLLNEAGCDSVVVTQIEIFDEMLIDVDQNMEVLTATTAGTSYQWVDCANNYEEIIGADQSVYTAMLDGSYAVIVSQGDCSDTSACFVVDWLGLNDNSLESSIRCYPNPTTGNVTIDLGTKQQTIHVYLRDAQGRLINTFKAESIDNLTVDLSANPVGIYHLNVVSEDFSKTFKLVKQNEK